MAKVIASFIIFPTAPSPPPHPFFFLQSLDYDICYNVPYKEMIKKYSRWVRKQAICFFFIILSIPHNHHTFVKITDLCTHGVHALDVGGHYRSYHRDSCLPHQHR